MLTFEHRVGGLFHYRRILFPERETVLEISRTIAWNQLLRLLVFFSDFNKLPHLVEQHQELTTCLDLSAGPDAVLRGMKKSSCLYMIRRAEKMLNSVEIEINSERAIRDFLPLYNGFARNKGPVPQLSARRFHEYLVRGDAIMLYQNGRPMSCHFLVRDPEASIVMLLYSGSRRLENSEDAAACGALNRYLHWYEMQHYCAQGIRTYDFGGIRYPEHPTARFKLSFGGPILTHHYYLLGGAAWIARAGYAARKRLFSPGGQSTSHQSMTANKLEPESSRQSDEYRTAEIT